MVLTRSRSGYKVVSTASLQNHDFVKSLGADAVFDYNDPQCGQKIKHLTEDNLRLCWDTISIDTSAEICAAALSSSSPPHQRCKYGVLRAIELPKIPRDDLEVTHTLMYTIFNETFHHQGGKEFPASQEDFDFARNFAGVVEELLQHGLLRTHPDKVGNEGLIGVLKGLQDLKEDRVSKQKLIYRVEETDKVTNMSIEF